MASSEKYTIAVAGNPNCGKTSVFNQLTGGKYRVGNWPGVTVEIIEGTYQEKDRLYQIIDLPGIYSLSASSEDEKLARDFLIENPVDMIINIADVNNLERNLYLTTQLMEMNIPVILVLNMMDIAKKSNLEIDIDRIRNELGIPVIGITAHNQNDIHQLKQFISENIGALQSPRLVKFPNEIEDIIEEWNRLISFFAEEHLLIPRWISLKILEGDDWVLSKIRKQQILSDKQIQEAVQNIEFYLKESVEIIIGDYRYGFIHAIYKKTVRKKISRQSVTDKIDQIVLNRFLGIPVFALIMFLVFWLTINLGGAFIDFFDKLGGALITDSLHQIMKITRAPEWLSLILVDGIGGGIQAVMTFIPIIFMMFFLLAILQDSGYIARAAFVMDRFMGLIGLPGKSFVPLVVGFGCTVPAILSTRLLESRHDRYKTIFMAPLMSCGARLPVYALMSTIFFPKSAGYIIFSIYLAGGILSILTGFLLKKTLFQQSNHTFMMELPAYHLPRFQHIMIHTWYNLKEFIFRAGIMIVVLSVFLSLIFGVQIPIKNDRKVNLLESIGKTITPVFTPMGIEKENWPATVSLFTGIFAKETIIGTMNSLYQQIEKTSTGSDKTESFRYKPLKNTISAFQTIPENMAGLFISPNENEDSNNTGSLSVIYQYFNPYAAYAFMLFVLIYFPCLTTLAVMVKEMGALLSSLSVIYLTLLAWIISTLFYQISYGHQEIWIIIPMVLLILMLIAFRQIGHHTPPDSEANIDLD